MTTPTPPTVEDIVSAIQSLDWDADVAEEDPEKPEKTTRLLHHLYSHKRLTARTFAVAAMRIGTVDCSGIKRIKFQGKDYAVLPCKYKNYKQCPVQYAAAIEMKRNKHIMIYTHEPISYANELDMSTATMNFSNFLNRSVFR
jgi:hypothetical protein